MGVCWMCAGQTDLHQGHEVALCGACLGALAEEHFGWQRAQWPADDTAGPWRARHVALVRQLEVTPRRGLDDAEMRTLGRLGMLVWKEPAFPPGRVAVETAVGPLVLACPQPELAWLQEPGLGETPYLHGLRLLSRGLDALPLAWAHRSDPDCANLAAVQLVLRRDWEGAAQLWEGLPGELADHNLGRLAVACAWPSRARGLSLEELGLLECRAALADGDSHCPFTGQPYAERACSGHPGRPAGYPRWHPVLGALGGPEEVPERLPRGLKPARTPVQALPWSAPSEPEDPWARFRRGPLQGELSLGLGGTPHAERQACLLQVMRMYPPELLPDLMAPSDELFAKARNLMYDGVLPLAVLLLELAVDHHAEPECLLFMANLYTELGCYRAAEDILRQVPGNVGVVEASRVRLRWAQDPRAGAAYLARVQHWSLVEVEMWRRLAAAGPLNHEQLEQMGHSEHVQVHLIRAWALGEQGRTKEARDAVEVLRRGRPHWDDARELEAELLAREGQEASAVALLREGLNSYPRSLRLLARLYVLEPDSRLLDELRKWRPDLEDPLSLLERRPFHAPPWWPRHD